MNPYLTPVVGNITATAQQVVLDVSDNPHCMAVVTGTFTGHNSSFEVSFDSTNGVNGNWIRVAGVRSDRSIAESTTGVIATGVAYSWIITTLGATYLRVRSTAHSTGTATWRLVPSEHSMSYNTENSAGSAAGTAVVGSPVRVGLRAKNVNQTVATDQLIDATGTLNGALVVKPHAIPEACWQGTGILTTTADLAIKTAAGASVRNYVSDISYQNTSATATGVVIKDGSTVIAQFHAPASMAVPAVINLQCPIKGTANTAINVAALVTAANVLVNLSGHIGA